MVATVGTDLLLQSRAESDDEQAEPRGSNDEAFTEGDWVDEQRIYRD